MNDNGDNLIFNTDWPHPDTPMPGAVDTFLECPVVVAAKRKILRDNAVQLYGERVVAGGGPRSPRAQRLVAGQC